MAISRIQSASANTTSASISTPTTGDLILVFAYRSATTAPTLPAGYTSINTASASSSSFRCGYKVSDGTETTSGTWTNATSVAVIVYRGAKVASSWKTPIGTFNNASGTTTALSYPFIGPQRFDSSSWVAVFAGISADQTWAAPTNTTTQTSTTRVLAADTGAGVANWPVTAVTASAIGNWKIAVVEIVADSSDDTVPVFDTKVLGVAVTTGATHTVAFAPTNGLPNSLVVAIAMFVDGATITGITWNGNAMTQIWNQRETILNQKGSACFVYPNGTGDGVSHNIVTTWGFTPSNGCNVAVFSYGNMDQSTMFRTKTSGQFDSTANSPAVQVTCTNATSGDIVIDSCCMGEHVNDVSQTNLYQQQPDMAGNNFVGGMSAKKATGSTTMGYTVGAAETIGQLVAAPLIPLAAATTIIAGLGSELLTGRANILGFGIGMPDVP